MGGDEAPGETPKLVAAAEAARPALPRPAQLPSIQFVYLRVSLLYDE